MTLANYIQLLKDSCTENNKFSHSLSSKTIGVRQEDCVAYWWASVLGVALAWLLGDEDKAEKLYPDVENFPKELLHSQYDLFINSLIYFFFLVL